VIDYEFPLSEKVRTMLRLECLFERMHHFTGNDHRANHHAALITLFEILEVASRADLKSELLQELERQKRSLSVLHNNPDIVEDALEAILADIERASAELHSAPGKTGQRLRENEWLMGIKQRANMPGGTCELTCLPITTGSNRTPVHGAKACSMAGYAPAHTWRVKSYPAADPRERQVLSFHRTSRHFPADAGRARCAVIACQFEQ